MLKYLLILILLIPSVNALTFSNDENYVYINGKYNEEVNIYYKGEEKLAGSIHLSLSCNNCRNDICEGECKYPLNVLDTKLDENYYFHVEDVGEGVMIFQFKEVEVKVEKLALITEKECEFDKDCILNVGEIVLIDGNKIELVKIGSTGAIIINLNDMTKTIPFDSITEIRKSKDTLIIIENKKADYNYGIATLFITKKIILTQQIFEKFKPFREDFYCFYLENRDKMECSNYWKKTNVTDYLKRLVCPQYYNPVCGSDGLFYPSSCWAEHFGTEVSFYGFCPSLIEFFKALWREEGFEVPSPNIEFSYQGSRTGPKKGVWLRSTLWEDPQNYNILDFNIWAESSDLDLIIETEILKLKTVFPVIGSSQKALLVFVMFDEAYPEQILLDWTSKYESLVNDYIAKKQKVLNPIQYNLIPVIIDPPEGVERLSIYPEEERQKIYNSARSKLEQSDFDILIISPVLLDGFGGYHSKWNNMEFIYAPLRPPEPYSIIDKQKGLDALAAFHGLFGVISHEILHTVGLSGDHIPMGYGTAFLDAIGQDVDPITGKERISPTWCDFFGISPDYYVVELPNNLKIYVNQEPDWLNKAESSSGPCLYGLYNNEYLKDYDNDGEYEILYKNNLIGIELQRSLGWEDVDGDNIPELIDQNAYGGWYIISYEEEMTCLEQGGNICKEGEICSGKQLITLNPEEKCCSEPCVIPLWTNCNECGKGIFNICDRKECNLIKENCYFEDWRNCIYCSSRYMSCGRYLDENDCNIDKCNLDCVWDSDICIPRPKLRPCGNMGGFCSLVIINPGQGGALINGECPLDKRYCIICIGDYQKDPERDACIKKPKEPIPEPVKPPEEKLKGDFNNDGCVNKDDQSLFNANYGKEVNELTKKYDLNNDGKINFSDFILFASNYNKCI